MLDLINAEHVVIVNEQNLVLGLAKKSEVHQNFTPLHRAFSCFLFREDGKFLVQQRAKSKKTWPLVWSNAFCGHPSIFESELEASKRRAKEEIGIEKLSVLKVSDFRYSLMRDEVMENEICPILLAFSKQEPKINLKEVEDINWLTLSEWFEKIKQNPDIWSGWCIQELEILQRVDLAELQKLLIANYTSKYEPK